ncbi:hypothetical protein AB0J01_27960 [Streptomyces sp. NPDC050204]|uniref:hypothetical protein n=1 Tax=Streptomyces sp. NPDC050204 TaxID=3155514 RepID=UPI00342C0CAD
MPDQDHDVTTDGAAADYESTAGRSNGTRKPATSAQWRQFLREDRPPEELMALPYLRRRRALRAWRTARRNERADWVRAERRKVPTPLTVPVVALLVAAAIGAATWLGNDNDDAPRSGAPASPTAEPAPRTSSPAPDPVPSRTVARPRTPEALARAFVIAYTTRIPLQDGSHKAAVQRGAPYASTALIRNLNRHDDLDWNQLIAAQATEAKPTKVTISRPADKEQPAPDTSVRVYRQAVARISVKGTDNYTYTRRLTIEISRADVSLPWTVTRVLGIQE